MALTPFVRGLHLMQLALASVRIGLASMVVGEEVDTYIEMTLPYPDACIASVLTCPKGPCKYAIKGGNPISDSIIKSLVPKIHATFGSKIAGVLALPLLWVAFEGSMMVNGYTFPIIPNQLASLIKER